MNCHILIKPDSKLLEPVHESWGNNTAIEWIRVHKVPDYAFFDHSAHVTRGVGCASCHGRVDQMEEVMLVEPLSMGWCLDCHRNPDAHLRPLDKVTQMDWTAPENQLQLAEKIKKERHINPPTDCTGCHR
jgi:hypothetical protein